MKMGPGMGLGGRGLFGGYPYNADSVALFARMSVQPTAARKLLIDDFIVGLQTDLGITALSQAFDCLWFEAAHDQQAARLNWVKNSHDLTEVNSPAWVVDRGYTSNGTTSYLNTNFTPATQGVKFLELTDGSYGCYCRTATGSGGTNMGSINTVTGFGTFINPKHPLGMLTRLASSTHTVSAVATELGLSVSDRPDNANIRTYKNGVLINNTALASTSDSLEQYILGYNLTGLPAINDTLQNSFAYYGNSAINKLQLYDRVQTFLTALGAQV